MVQQYTAQYQGGVFIQTMKLHNANWCQIEKEITAHPWNHVYPYALMATAAAVAEVGVVVEEDFNGWECCERVEVAATSAFRCLSSGNTLSAAVISSAPISNSAQVIRHRRFPCRHIHRPPWANDVAQKQSVDRHESKQTNANELHCR